MKTLYCYRSGEILVTPNCPQGAVALGIGPEAVIDQAIEALACIRQTVDGGLVFMVPGLAEATSDDEAIRIVKGFRFQVKEFLENPPERKLVQLTFRGWSPELLDRINAA